MEIKILALLAITTTVESTECACQSEFNLLRGYIKEFKPIIRKTFTLQFEVMPYAVIENDQFSSIIFVTTSDRGPAIGTHCTDYIC
jgi:hypothetical protein